ncbi:MAG TPA: GFA family protein [Phenylobacterium sp.]
MRRDPLPGGSSADGHGVCHCRDCQRASGGGPNYIALAPKSAFSVIAGTAKVHTTTADSGGKVGRAFCPECGTPLWSEPAMDLPFVPIKAGALDDASALTPMFHLWTGSAQPWHTFDASAPRFETNPPAP